MDAGPGMAVTIKEHMGAGLVAAGVIAAAMAQGLFEPGGYAAGSIVLWAIVIGGLATRRLPPAPVTRIALVAGACLAATAVLSVASIAWAADPGRAFEGAIRVSFYLGLFTLAVCTASRPARAQWLAGLAVGLGAVSVIVLLAYLQPGLLGNEPNDVPNALGRLAYPVGYWNGAGALLAAAGALLAYGAVRAPQRPLRVAANAAIPLVLLGIWLANSRGAGAALLVGWIVLVAASSDRGRFLRVIGLGLAGALALILVTRGMHALTSGTINSDSRAQGDQLSAVCVGVTAAVCAVAWVIDDWVPRIRIGRSAAVAMGLAGVVVVVVALVAIDPTARFDEFKSPPAAKTGVPVGSAELSSNGRWQFWIAAIDAFGAHPVDGVGAGGFENWWALHPKTPLFVRNPHSLPLQQAAELGIPGIALFVGFIGALAVAARRRLKGGLDGDAGVLVAVVTGGAIGAAVDWTWQIPAVFGPVLACSALLVGSASSRPVRNGTWLGLATVVAAWIAIVGGGIVALTQLELKRSRDAAAAGDYAAAADRARTARAIQPWSSKPYLQLAQLYGQNGDVPGALRYLGQAEQRDSNDWRLALVEGTLQQRLDRQRAAARAFKRAERLSPFPLVSLLQPQRPPRTDP